MESLSVLIVDDEPAFRSGLRALLQSAEAVSLCGEAETGEAAIGLAAELQPDVILMDINLGGLNGIEATRRILATSPHIGILMLTMFQDDDSVFAAMRAGARGYLLKGALKGEILRAIQAVGAGGVIFGAAVAQRLMRYFAGLGPLAPANLLPELTDREREILALVAQGYTNPEIAQRLVLSGKTIRNHISNIFSKLQVADRTQAIIRARNAGLGLG